MPSQIPLFFKRRSLALLLVAALAPAVSAQETPPSGLPALSENEAGAPEDLRYIGAPFRAGAGYQSENMWRGELFWAFRETENTAWLAEGYLTTASAGGARLSFHWQPADDKEALIRKLFAAFDQNRDHDRKVTAGGGMEGEHWFGSLYGSAGVTGRREVDDSLFSSTRINSGVENNHAWSQEITTTTYTRTFERAYDWGVGVRGGRFHDDWALRWFGGVDYEWGQHSTSQITGTLGVEKFFVGTPHSIALVGEAYHKRGDYEIDKNDQRILAMYRFSFGGPLYRPAKQYRDVQVEVPATSGAAAATEATPAGAVPKTEKRIVKTTATAEADVFFKFDKADLQPEAGRALDSVVERLRSNAVEGNIYITGHTCNIGSATYNQKLSERRAYTVRQYLASKGVPADTLIAEGKGMREPRYPNDKEGRPKNRRVDIEFITHEDRAEDVEVMVPAAVPPKAEPRIEWRREEIAEEPAWARRALRSPVQHKQMVDVYRTQESTTTVTEGPVVVENQPPIARDDYAVAGYNRPVDIDVLANDSDPDGDTLRIVSFTQPRSGTVTASDHNTLIYRARDGYIGYDSFQYTIDDGYGGRATATVTVFADP